MAIVDKWMADIPQQFQGKKNIELFFNAFAKQLEELKQVFEEVNSKTQLDTATGKNLDYVGNQLSMTRKEATELLMHTTDYVLTDELYRKCLNYQVLKETGSCTYEEIMGSVFDLWEVDTANYIENIDEPATIRLQLGSYFTESVDPSVGKVLMFKPAGVKTIFEIGYVTEIDALQFLELSLFSLGIYFDIIEWNWGEKKLDGSWILDGSTYFASLLAYIPVKVNLAPIKLINWTHPDYVWHLDGHIELDGMWPVGAEEEEQMTVYINGEQVKDELEENSNESKTEEEN